MNKYIIKNCPSHLFDIEFNEHICTQTDNLFECGHNYCQDCTNCLLKRIVEKAKNASPYNFLSEDILRMLEIEELSNE